MWRYGPIGREQKRLDDLLKAITTLKHHGLRGTGVIGAYHVKRLVKGPNMARGGVNSLFKNLQTN